MPRLLGTFAVVAVAALFVVDPFNLFGPSEKEATENDPTRRMLIDLKRDELTAFEIKNADEDAFRIEKDDGRWYVVAGGKRTKADMERVDKMLEELPGLRAYSLATEDPKLYDQMEVSDGKALLLKVYSGGTAPVATLHVGKAGPSYKTSFVRIDAGKEVWNAGTNVKSLTAYSSKDYRTKKPWTFAQDTATQLELVKFSAPEEKENKAPPPALDSPKLEFELKDGIWKHGDSNGNQNAIKEFLKSLSDLQINEYLDEPDNAVTQLDGRAPSITVKTAEGEFTLTMGAKDVSYWYVRDQDGNSYKVSDYALQFYRELDWDKLTFDDTAKEADAKATDTGEAEPEPDGAAEGEGG